MCKAFHIILYGSSSGDAVRANCDALLEWAPLSDHGVKVDASANIAKFNSENNCSCVNNESSLCTFINNNNVCCPAQGAAAVGVVVGVAVTVEGEGEVRGELQSGRQRQASSQMKPKVALQVQQRRR